MGPIRFETKQRLYVPRLLMPSVVAARVESKPMLDALRPLAPYPSFKSESSRLWLGLVVGIEIETRRCESWDGARV